MTSVFDHGWLKGLFADSEIANLWAAETQMVHMLRFEAAWARALGAPDVAAQIAGFLPDMDQVAAGTAQDGVPVPALVRQLKAAYGVEGVHQGLTSQDVVDSALTLTMQATIDVFQTRITGLIARLDAVEDVHGDRSLMGRTRMQAATPITVADRVATWRLPHMRHAERLGEVSPRIGVLSLGGASGNRAAMDDDGLQVMAEELGCPVGEKTWHAMRDGVTEFASILSLITGTCGKMGQDICLMAQQGIDEIKISGGGGSSAMPHKQNPVQAELLVTLARFNATQVSGIHHAMVHEQERSGAAWALEWMILPQMAQATGRALIAATDLAGSIERIGTG